MIPLGRRHVLRQLQARSTLGSARSQDLLPPKSLRSRTATSPGTLVGSKRISEPSSRVSQLNYTHCSRQYSSLLEKIQSPPSPSHPVLHSAFPTKTVLFLLTIGGLAYYFIDIKYRDWTDQVFDSFSGDPTAGPLHFFDTKEAVDHWMQFHAPDPTAPLKNPEVLKQINERFKEVAFGWEMTEEDAVEWEMPVTHGCRFRSNEPCEDYFAVGTAPGPGGNPWNYWSVFDGHAGRHTALYLQWTMHPVLSRNLSDLPVTASSFQINNTIKRAFTALDNDIMSRARNAANWYPAASAAATQALSPAFSGSCALVATFDPEKNKLRVACTGDSRAVLGRWDDVEGKYVAQPLSIDQTGFNASEVSRIKEAHPDEDDILDPNSGRLLGIAVTRAFGDHRWKWDNSLIKQCQVKFWGTSPRPKSKTPPYLTAEPEITETDIVRVDPKKSKTDGQKSDFMIMASDGLWDHMSNEVAVQCVQSWLEARARNPDSLNPASVPSSAFTPSFNDDASITYDVEGAKEITWKAEPKYFAIEDDNAAVCLTRNAMGGNRRGLFLGLLSIPGPFCRDAVDDTTVMVVFFDKVEGKKGQGKGGEGAEKKKKSWWPWTHIQDVEIAEEFERRQRQRHRIQKERERERQRERERSRRRNGH